MSAERATTEHSCATGDWLALQTKYRCEKKVADQLANNGVDVFLPVRQETHRWSDRQKRVTIPLFPGYIFARLPGPQDTRVRVLQTAGIYGFVSFGMNAGTVPAKQIDDLRLLLKRDVPFSLFPFVKTGQRVRIRGGCLSGIEGILLNHDQKKLLISVATIEQSLAIEIHGYELELV